MNPKISNFNLNKPFLNPAFTLKQYKIYQIPHKNQKKYNVKEFKNAWRIF